MFGLLNKKQIIKVNFLNPDHPDGYFVSELKVKSSIIKKYAHKNELFAMKSEMPVGDRFQYEGVTYRYWDNLQKWMEIKSQFSDIDESYSDLPLNKAFKKTLNIIKGE